MDLDKLEKLNELKEKGIITPEEFAEKKKEFMQPAKISIFDAYKNCFTKYFQISGRSNRKEYWSFVLVNFLIQLLLSIFGIALGEAGNIILGLYGLAVFIPSITVFIRRLHDTNHSAWILPLAFVFMLVMGVLSAMLSYTGLAMEVNFLHIVSMLVIIAFWIYIFYLLVKKGDEKENKYGPAPIKG